MSRRERKLASRKRRKTEDVQVDSSTSDWSLELEGKRLHMNMVDECSFESLIKLREDPESLDIMDKAATIFSSHDRLVVGFRKLVRRLELSASCIFYSEAQDTSDDKVSDMKLLSILPQDKERRVRFDNPISSCDAEMKESIDDAPASDDSDDTTLFDGSEQDGSSMNDAAASDDSDDKTWSDGSEQAGSSMKNEALTSMLKTKFLEIIGSVLSTTCGLEMDVSFGPRIVNNGSSRFSSTNDGRYSFHLPDHVFGGAEVFGTEDKRRSISKTNNHKDKLQIQVAGEMLATVFHRNVLGTRDEYREEILEACPNLEAWQTETSRTVYYLVFTHLSLRIAKAIFDLKYLNHVWRGYLPENLKADIMWSHRLQLNHEEDLRKAARLVMCLMLNFRDEFVSGKHYWLPYKAEDGITFWVIH